MPIAIIDEHQELAASVRGVLARTARWRPTGRCSRPTASRGPRFGARWRRLGWLGIHLPERHGGAGAGLAELVVVLEEVGRQVAPGPFLPTVLASAVIADCGTETQRAALLPGLADGSTVAALGLGGSLTLARRRARR